MKKTLNLILILISVFSSLKAEAVILNNSEIKSAIIKQVGENYKKYTDAQLNIEVIALPFKDLDIPTGKVSYKIESSANKFMPRDLEKVSIYVNDKCVKTFNAPIIVKAYEDILVASSFINIGQRITPSIATVKKLEISNTLGYQLKSDSLGKDIIAKKAFREGEIIDKRFVKLKPDIMRNANVTVFFNTNDLTITTEAIALSDGIVGDSICLMNKNYNKVYTGKIIGENKVLVKI